MNHIIKGLGLREGRYIGKGINHDNESFEGIFTITPIIDYCGIEITFEAKGDQGEVYHFEKTTIALSHDGKPYMWSINNNAPYLFQHELRENQTFDVNNEKIVFGYNDPDDRESFREEVKLELFENGDIGYHYYWGLPGGDFAYRSGLKMTKYLDHQ